MAGRTSPSAGAGSDSAPIPGGPLQHPEERSQARATRLDLPATPGHARALKTLQAQELQKCVWPQGLGKVLATWWEQMAHSSPARAGKGTFGVKGAGGHGGSPLVSPPEDGEARGPRMRTLPHKRMLIVQSVKKAGKRMRQVHTCIASDSNLEKGKQAQITPPMCGVLCLVPSAVSDSATPWTRPARAPRSTEILSQEHWNG